MKAIFANEEYYRGLHRKRADGNQKAKCHYVKKKAGPWSGDPLALQDGRSDPAGVCLELEVSTKVAD